jgi:5'-deoxynucleotidase YfbR-like HD superfamily hydrolase
MVYTIKLKEYLKEERAESEEEKFVSDLDAITKTYKEVVGVAKKFRPILAEAIETVENYERGQGQKAAILG